MKKELKDKYVYLHRDVNNTIFYVGVGGDSRHRNTRERSTEWKAIAKDGYSIDVHKKEITLSEAFQIEIDLIELIGRKDLDLGTLVNKTDGGAGTRGLIFTEERRKRISEIRSASRGFKHSNETKKKMSKAHSGENNAMFGRKASNETREKMSKSRMGLKKTQEQCDAQSLRMMGEKNPMFGRKHTEESKKNLSVRFSGKNNPNFGKTTSKETKEKCLATKRRKHISDEKYKLLLEDFSKIDKIKRGVTYGDLSTKYNVRYELVKRWFLKYKKNK